MLRRLLAVKRILSPGMKRIVSPYFTEVTKMAEQKEELGEPVKKKQRKAHVKVVGYGDGGDLLGCHWIWLS